MSTIRIEMVLHNFYYFSESTIIYVVWQQRDKYGFRTAVIQSNEISFGFARSQRTQSTDR